ncbi:CCA tRNA nucleotidyltransferase, mitochondrial [Gonapodya sp. JEL0774]|nr:CCA tRNA nucleotidyltransferase, mitochondrial [Gonapodya sp. JEL0774]
MDIDPSAELASLIDGSADSISEKLASSARRLDELGFYIRPPGPSSPTHTPLSSAPNGTDAEADADADRHDPSFLWDEDFLRMVGELEVRLTPKEEELAAVLVECAEGLAKSGKAVTLRIAGGWVRDKLLSIDSHDIDIALDTMSGVDFANHLTAFLSARNHPIEHLARIAANPDRSKHLETATGRVLGVEVDFVRLRAESYAEGSRVPTVTEAGPEEDAERRDITINSMFYNLHTRKVEDFTGKGVRDLLRHHIETPLPALRTFLDDPLRVLRVVRFASRFGYSLHGDIRTAARDERVSTALMQKISRERVGVEVDKCLKGPDPYRSIHLINAYGIYPSVFSPPPTLALASDTVPPSSSIPDDLDSIRFAGAAHWFLADATYHSQPPAYVISSTTAPSAPLPNTSQEGTGRARRVALPARLEALRRAVTDREGWRRAVYLCAAVAPYRRYKTVEKKRDVAAVKWVVKEALKLKNEDGDLVTSLFSSTDAISILTRRISSLPFPSPSTPFTTSSLPATDLADLRESVGLLIRDLGHGQHKGLKEKWEVAVLVGMAEEVVGQAGNEESVEDDLALPILERYARFLEVVDALGVAGAWEMKPMLSGDDLVRVLNRKPGPGMRDILAAVVSWQLRNPTGGKEECEAWVRENEGRWG